MVKIYVFVLKACAIQLLLSSRSVHFHELAESGWSGEKSSPLAQCHYHVLYCAVCAHLATFIYMRCAAKLCSYGTSRYCGRRCCDFIAPAALLSHQ